MLNPDDLRQVTVLSKETKDIITADLKMTTFADLTLEGALAVMRSASEANPELRTLHERHLSEARTRRVRESGFFPDSDLPSSYVRIDKLRRDAAEMAHVEVAPLPRSMVTSSPGSIMDRSEHASPRQTVPTSAEELTDPLSETHPTELDAQPEPDDFDDPAANATPMFKPFTESKV